ncbi:MAG: hypothetical protein ACLQGP_05715 [Isosphaeraceae bacterium]
MAHQTSLAVDTPARRVATGVPIIDEKDQAHAPPLRIGFQGGGHATE